MTPLSQSADEVVDRLKQDPDRRLRALQRCHSRAINDLRYLMTDCLGYDGRVEGEPDFRVPAYDEVFRFMATWRRMNWLWLQCRGTAKSLLSAGWLMQQGFRDPNVRMMALSARFDNACNNSVGRVRAWMTTGAPIGLIEVMGPFGKLPKAKEMRTWGKTEALTFPKRTLVSEVETLEAGGIDQRLASKHFNIVLGDDVVDPLELTREGIAVVEDRWRLTEGILIPGGVRGLNGTLWAEYDLYNKKRVEHEERLKAGLPGLTNILVLNDRLDDGWKCPECGKVGTPRWPHMPEEILHQKRHEMGSFRYASQYELRLIASGESIFREESFRGNYWLHDEVFDADGKVRPRFICFVFSDLAGSTEDGGDNSAHLVVAMDERRHLFVLDAALGRFLPEQNLNIMSDWYHRYRALYVGVEGGVLRTVYEPLVRQWNARYPTRRFLMRKIENGGSRGSANDRALRIQPFAEAREIHLRGNGTRESLHPSQVELLDQLLGYTGIDNTPDDFVAALTLAANKYIVGGQSEPEPEKPKSLSQQIDEHVLAKCEEAWAGVGLGDWSGVNSDG